jgi:glucosamine-6-phosphate deaminase
MGGRVMKILIVNSNEELAKAGYNWIVEILRTQSTPVLGMATGSSPMGIYKLMRENHLDVSHTVTVNLDEYINVPANHENSYHCFMRKQLFDHISFKKNFLPNGMAENLQEECLRYEQVLDEYPVDLQILGIGENGHIGFNEPGTSFSSRTHVIQLTESTRHANRRFFNHEHDVPTHAITMGIASIMKAKRIMLLAMGTAKASAVRQLLEGPITEKCPATILREHPDVLIITDQQALSLCSEESLYEHQQVFSISNLLSNSRMG